MFNENWYSDKQIEVLIKTIKKNILKLEGSIVEIGCWEGKSTIAIANTCYPEILEAVDTWKGNYDEDPNHPSVILAQKRDVFSEFNKNISKFTKGNVRAIQQDCFEYLKKKSEPIKFCHIDASHDYYSVKKTIEMLLPKLVNGAILCGDDYGSGKHKRLFGGVKRAVKEMCKGHKVSGRFWSYKYKG
jgi:hypothetical protein